MDPDRNLTELPSAARRALERAGIETGAPIGRGSTSVVVAARLATGERVAVKVAFDQPAARRSLAREAVALRRVHRRAGDRATRRVPFVVDVIDVDGSVVDDDAIEHGALLVRDDVAAVVMQACGPTSLSEWLRAHPARGATDLVRIELARQLVDALETIHAAGIVHGDLSTNNVVVDDDGIAVVDFGASCIDGDAGPLVRGTLPYVAPELLRREPPGPASDRFALAHVLMELFAGDRANAAPEDEWEQLLTATGTAPAVIDLVLRGVAAHPSDRPSTDAWRDALERWANGDPAFDGANDPATVEPRATRDPGAPVSPGAPVIDLTDAPSLADRTTVDFGPRPPRPDADTRDRRANAPVRRAGAVAATTTAVIALLVLVFALTRSNPGTTTTAEASPVSTVSMSVPGTAPTPRTSDHPAASHCGPLALPHQFVDAWHAPSSPDPLAVQIADVDGSGCPDTVAWNGEEAIATVARGDHIERYRLGQPGDELVVGRWACAAIETPLLYRPSTGDVFVFDAWAGEGAPAASARVEHRGITNATVEVRPDATCDRLDLHPNEPNRADHART